MQSTLSRNHGGLPHSDVLQLSAVPLLSWWTPFGSQTGNLESFNQVKCLFPDQPREDSESSGNSLTIQNATRHGSAQFNPEKSILSATRSSILLDFCPGDGNDSTKLKKDQQQYGSLSIYSSTFEEQPSFELGLGQPMVYTNCSYGDQQYGLVAAYGAQHGRLLLPLHMTKDEPVYVNAKQYHGILRRRLSRAKAASENKLIKARKPYLHESRHLHAMRRARGCGGRFLNTKKAEQTDCRNGMEILKGSKLSQAGRSPNSDSSLTANGKLKSTEVHFRLNLSTAEMTNGYSHEDANHFQVEHMYPVAFGPLFNTRDGGQVNGIPCNRITAAENCCDLLKV
ncbi:nuclear transcription factor Y subunit A-10-like isoform X2 [Nymphaea colorata]|uniref:nuclear transcription factor Y subunit A-10-like isoform X2 n=1 Tax=Nymphaea colorata TaxID=210225 RepID=UPI00129DED90|nr:nuclear transcription factor Y subunit A-10-like isoform X2 [Nymphaea colorata]